MARPAGNSERSRGSCRGLPTEVLPERIFRVYLDEFAPHTAGLIYLSEMAQGGGQHGARKIRAQHQQHPLAEWGRLSVEVCDQEVENAERPEYV